MHLSHIHPSLENKKFKNVLRLDGSFSDDPKCLDTSLNFFYINFCNIHSLRSNFQSVEHHLSSTKPYLFSSSKHSCLM
ncbi:hypothetical protein E2C01_043467 [Portunus trituberculatus]|uniref:Uncharacterized protein n=1 Tax=Portunus trituberculatus TaxID=210409 RepID=A0A5B7FW78_PORTR|nr:hypothetical protein [Portunus trituberculatus]